MRVAWEVIAVGLVGAVIGWRFSAWHWKHSGVDFGPTAWNFADANPVKPPGGEDQPEARLLDGDNYDFGAMSFDETQKHEFRISNTGTKPLTLELLDTTCSCTIGELQEDEIAPGETTTVTLTWTASGYDPEFRQTATLRTNDPDTPTIQLSVHGRVLLVVQAEPTKLALSQVSRSDPGTYSIALYGFRETPLEVREVVFDQPDTAQYFKAEVVPMPSDQLKLQPEASSGVLVNIQLLEGLPLGPLRQTARILTNQPQAEEVTIPIEINVASDITFVAGRLLDRELNLIHLGRVPQSKGKEVSLKLLAKGPHREGLEIVVKSTDPDDVLQVEIGPPNAINKGLVYAYPVTVRVPPGARQIDRFGRDLNHVGKVVFGTNHPQITELELYVSFVVYRD